MVGEADSAFMVIGYAVTLEAQGRFSEVRIARVDECKITETETTGAESTRVSFVIVISK